MKTKFLTALLTALAPLAAQADVAGGADGQVRLDRERGQTLTQAPTLGFEIQVRDREIGMQLSSPVPSADAMGIVTANCTGETLTISGFPLLLVPHAVILVAPFAEGQEFTMPYGGLPYDLYLQAGAFVQGQILVSAIRKVEARDE